MILEDINREIKKLRRMGEDKQMNVMIFFKDKFKIAINNRGEYG